MEHALQIIKESINDHTFLKCTISGPRNKNQLIQSISIKPVKAQNEIKIEYRLKKHNDIITLKKEIFLNGELGSFLQSFKQVHLKGSNKEIQILFNKKLKAKILTKDVTKDSLQNQHNKQKKYLIPDGEPCAFLIEIGVMDFHGKVKPNYYKKFKQINRFLEYVDDLYKNEVIDKLHIVDFGCGKSYLTFSLYHYFKYIRKIEIKITGIDLKQEVIDHCNEIAQSIGFDKGLNFSHGLIHDFKTDETVDFVVTLHACDTATDDAILFSLENKAKKMIFVPCCQHELNKQIENSESSIMLKHGIFRDRMCSLITDTARSQLLEVCGYKVQNMEFIDLQHTAKNVMLRCVQVKRSTQQTEDILKKYKSFKNQWKINPYLEKKLIENKII